jgi:hypothetical protein
VDEVFTVNVLYSGDELVGQEEDSLQAEPPRAEVEEVLQARAQQLHHHHVVVTCKESSFTLPTLQTLFRIRIQSGQWIRIQEGKNYP